MTLLPNRERRIQYLGFDDKWFAIIGILVLALITSFLFNDSFGKGHWKGDLISYLVSLAFTILNWAFMRSVLLYIRVRYPSFEDSGKRILILFLILVSSVVFINELGNVVLESIFQESYNKAPYSRILIPVVLISTMIQAIYEAIYYYVRLKKAVRDEEQAKQATTIAQLTALKNQAQPHFFFNTMNTLRDIIDQNSKEEAMDFVDQLSDVYRYILDTGNINLIPLKDEIQFARAYLHIQKERFGKNLKINWEIDQNYHSHLIAPMTLQLLLENAIKHNVVSKSYPLTIDILMDKNNLIVSNAIKAKSSVLSATKMGLANIVKRYDLLSMEKPTITNDGIIFKVGIPLIIKSN